MARREQDREWEGVRRAYPRAPADAIRKAPLRHSDQIAGGTWEAFERMLQKGGYFSTGLRKAEVAKAIGEVFEPAACRSPSFRAFHEAILDAVAKA